MTKITFPFRTTTVAKYKAIINEQNRKSSDIWIGSVILENYRGAIDVQWDYAGICRDQPSAFNLQMSDPANEPLRKPFR